MSEELLGAILEIESHTEETRNFIKQVRRITRLGIRWTKPFANPFGPFIWGMIERERREYLIFH